MAHFDAATHLANEVVTGHDHHFRAKPSQRVGDARRFDLFAAFPDWNQNSLRRLRCRRGHSQERAVITSIGNVEFVVACMLADVEVRTWRSADGANDGEKVIVVRPRRDRMRRGLKGWGIGSTDTSTNNLYLCDVS